MQIQVRDTCKPWPRDHGPLRQAPVRAEITRINSRSLEPCAFKGKSFCTASKQAHRKTQARPAATPTQPGSVETEEEAIAKLKVAATNKGVPATEVFQALWQLEKLKLQEDSWNERLGEGDGGRRWKLIFTAGAKEVKKGPAGKGKGFYLPITAVQRWEMGKKEIENGIYLGQLGALAFKGPYEYQKKKLSFDFTQLSIRLGPKWIPFNIKSMKKGDQEPFFLFFYVDEEIACARGRGGGYALWQRTTADWDLKAGVTL